jgi:hypothetical protein
MNYEISFFFSLNTDGVTPNFDLITVENYPCGENPILEATSEMVRSPDDKRNLTLFNQVDFKMNFFMS